MGRLTYLLSLTGEDVNTISDALGELPAKRVLALIAKLQSQINQQNDAVTDPPKERSTAAVDKIDRAIARVSRKAKKARR